MTLENDPTAGTEEKERNIENVFECSSFKYNTIRRSSAFVYNKYYCAGTLKEFPPPLQSLSASPRFELAPSHTCILLFSGDHPLLPAYIRFWPSDQVYSLRPFPLSRFNRLFLVFSALYSSIAHKTADRRHCPVTLFNSRLNCLLRAPVLSLS